MKTIQIPGHRRAAVRAGAFAVATTLLSLALFNPLPARATPTNSPPRVLILDETVVGGTNSQEALAAQIAIPGCAVDMVSVANWYSIPSSGTGGPSGFGFDQYRAVIIGDAFCDIHTNYVSAMTALNVTKAVWTPAITGNIIIEGVDNAWHATALSFPAAVIGADKTIKRGIGFAVNDPTRTGFYYAMGCFYDYANTGVTNAILVPHLTGFGTFMVRGYAGVCFDAAHIVATHPVLTNPPALTDAELSNWGCSTHEGFDVWPPSFTVLAIALTNGAYTATDGSNGIPYMLFRGLGVQVISSIQLGPEHATNNIGTTHTVCALIATNVVPRTNVPVTFTIVAGPNSVTTHTNNTDGAGVACFTYTGGGGPGLDYLTASYRNSLNQVITSRTVTKLWAGTCVSLGCQTLQCLADGAWNWQFCVTNLNPSPLQYVSLFNAPAGVSFTPNLFNLSPPLANGQSTNLSVIIHGPVGSSICFQVGAHATNEAILTCAISNCLSLPACCNRVVTNSLTFVSTVGNVSTYNYSITLQNVTGSPLKFVGFASGQSCVTFVPAMLDLTQPAYGGPGLLLPGLTRTLNLQVRRTAPCPGTNEFRLSALDTNLVACCSTRLTLPPARCVTITLPYHRSYALANTPVQLNAKAFNPCSFTWVKFYDGTTELGPATLTTGGVYALTINGGFAAGTHSLSAVAQLDAGTAGDGELETSEPVELIVIAPSDPPDHDH